MFVGLRLWSAAARPVWLGRLARRGYCMKTSEPMELLLKRHDYVPRSYELIYRQRRYKGGAFMYHAVMAIASVSVTTLGYFWYLRWQDPSFKFEDPSVDVHNPWKGGFLLIINFFMVYLAVTTRKRWPIRIYYDANRKVFRSIHHGAVPFTQEFHEFPANSLSYVSKTSILPWRLSQFRTDSGRKIILFDEKFRTPNDFHQMLKPDQI